MTSSRDLSWDGCLNVRDLGGLPTADGHATRAGAVIRGDHPSFLTPAGWSALWDHGVRTIVSLETDSADPQMAASANRPFTIPDDLPELTRVRVGIEDGDDSEFMSTWADTGLWGTPLYFETALARWPQRHAAAVAAVADAAPGGVLIHCGRGCDRTGILSLLLLDIAGVSPEDIAADYALSFQRLAPREPGYEEKVTAILAERDTSPQRVVADLVRSFNSTSYLSGAGLPADTLSRMRSRLTASPPV